MYLYRLHIYIVHICVYIIYTDVYHICVYIYIYLCFKDLFTCNRISPAPGLRPPAPGSGTAPGSRHPAHPPAPAPGPSPGSGAAPRLRRAPMPPTYIYIYMCLFNGHTRP